MDVRTTGDGMPVAALEGIERWFIDRGLPHFVERRDPASAIWARALPLLIFAYLLLGLNALDLTNWSRVRNLAVAVFILAASVVTWFAANWLRGRRFTERPRRVGPAELAVFIVVPTLPSVFVGQWGDAVQTLVQAIALLAVLWALTSYGVLPLLRWAARRTRAQLGLLFNVVVRALPLVLLFLTFLFINAEVWQVAGTITGPVYVAVLAIFFLLGAVFLLSRVPSLMRQLNDFGSWTEIADLVAGTPARTALERWPAPARPPGEDRMSTRQRMNIGLVTSFSQAIQITMVALTITGFFVLFGFLAIPVDTIEGWTGLEEVNVLASWSTEGRSLVLTEPLLRVAAFLGAFSGMYFTVLLSTDSVYRDEFADDVAPELRQALAVRRVYRSLRGLPAEVAKT